MSFQVKVIRLPGAVKSVTVNEGSTVSDALREAGFALEQGFTLTVDGVSATVSTALKAGANIIVSQGAKGNSIVEHHTLVDGRNVLNLDEDDLLDAAVKVKSEIKRLSGANEGLESAAIAKRIVSLQADLKEVVKLLDAKSGAGTAQ
jgi:hypothetical protein